MAGGGEQSGDFVTDNTQDFYTVYGDLQRRHRRLTLNLIDETTLHDINLEEDLSLSSKQGACNISTYYTAPGQSTTTDTMPSPTLEKADPLRDGTNVSITSDDDFEQIDAQDAMDRSTYQDRINSSMVHIPSHSSDFDPQSETPMSGSTVSIADHTDAGDLSEHEADDSEPYLKLTMPSMDAESQNSADAKTPKAGPRFWQSPSPIASRFVEDMKDSEVTVKPALDLSEESSKKGHTSLERPEMGHASDNIKHESIDADYEKNHPRVPRTGLTRAFVSKGLLTILALLFLVFSTLSNLIPIKVHLTVPDAKTEMTLRHQQLQKALELHHITDGHNQIIDAQQALIYPTAHKIDTNGVDVLDAEYYRPTTITALSAGIDQIFVSLPQTARGGRYSTKPTIGARTSQKPVGILQQIDLIDGVTYVRLSVDDLEESYFIDIRCDGQANTFQITLTEEHKKHLLARTKTNSIPSQGMGGSHDDKTAAILSMLDEFFASQKQKLAETMHTITEAKSVLGQDLSGASQFLNQQLAKANSRGKKLVETATDAFTINREDALRELSEMGDVLYQTTYDVFKSANDIVGKDVISVVTATQKDIQTILERARRNGRGILERVKKNIRSKRGKERSLEKPWKHHQRCRGRRKCESASEDILDSLLHRHAR